MEFNKQNSNGTDAVAVLAKSSIDAAYKANQLPKLTFEITVVDPDSLYSSEDDSKNEDSDKTEDDESPKDSSLLSNEMETIDPDAPILSDFELLNVKEDVVLPETDFLAEHDDTFDLGSYLIDQKTSLALPPSLEPAPIETEELKEKEEMLTVRKPITLQNINTAKDIASNRRKRKNEIRDCSGGSDDTCNRDIKKPKKDDKPSSNSATTAQVSTTIKESYIMWAVNHRRKCGLGHGKDFATLYNCLKSSNDKCNSDEYRKLIKASVDNAKAVDRRPIKMPKLEKEECSEEKESKKIPSLKENSESKTSCHNLRSTELSNKFKPLRKRNRANVELLNQWQNEQYPFRSICREKTLQHHLTKENVKSPTRSIEGENRLLLHKPNE